MKRKPIIAIGIGVVRAVKARRHGGHKKNTARINGVLFPRNFDKAPAFCHILNGVRRVETVGVVAVPGFVLQARPDDLNVHAIDKIVPDRDVFFVSVDMFHGKLQTDKFYVFVNK